MGEVLHMSNDAFAVKGVLSAEECAEWIAAAEAAGYAKSGEDPSKPLFSGGRARAMIFDQAKADVIFERIAHLLKPRRHNTAHRNFDFIRPGTVCPAFPPSGLYTPNGMNECLRFSRYDAGGVFDWHVDTGTYIDEDNVALCSVLIYLNSGYEGGETLVQEAASNTVHTLKPETGMVLVFYHYLLHKGEQVLSGNKLVCRSEVLYRWHQGSADTQ